MEAEYFDQERSCSVCAPAQSPLEPRAETLRPIQAALRRRAGDFRTVRFAAGLRRALPARLAAIFLFAGWRRGAAFFFAILAMVGSLFLFSQMVFLPKNESTILE
jgi:hypothetical protein